MVDHRLRQLIRPIWLQILDSIESYVGCVSGAILKDEYMKLVKEAGFSDVDIISEIKASELGYTSEVVEALNSFRSLTYCATKRKEAE